MPAPPVDGPLERIRRVLAGQAKMHAIKRYRESTGSGWAEAAEAVERIRAGGRPAPEKALAPPAVSAEARAVGAALDAGKTIEAIRLYRAATGVGLKEAKHAIDAMIAEKDAGRRPARSSPVGPRVVERRRIGPMLILLSLAALFGTVFGLVILLTARN
jgi:ribosomal protein L7/L12